MGLGAVVSVAPIEVVLPTYNGVSYLEAQITSIYNQSLRPERLLLRDDGSSDGTLALISQLQQRYGTWLQVLPADGNLGCMANVNRLLDASKAPYVAFADQDDLWLPQKLELSLNRLRRTEKNCGSQTPVLVHSDLELIDKEGMPLGCTYFERQRINPERTAPKDLALTNVVTGCTALVNRSLLEQALPIPSEALMHDWWIALVACAFGRIELLPMPTILYRQHTDNLLGAKGLGMDYWLQKLVSLSVGKSASQRFRQLIHQSFLFEQRYGHQISVLPHLSKLSRLRRLITLLQLESIYRPRKHGPLRTAALYGIFTCLSC
jgi:glycosyltransferase involved in cell wall biosynthesis